MQCNFILGGLFDISESKQEVAFRYAVERINSNRKILPKSLVSAQIEKIPPQDSFHASKRGKVCFKQFSIKERSKNLILELFDYQYKEEYAMILEFMRYCIK